MRPILFSIGHFQFLSGPIFAGLSALAAYLYMRRYERRLSPEDHWGLMLALSLAVLLGGALAYLLLYGGGPAANLRGLLRRGRISGGTFYGSFWAAAAVAWVYCRVRKLSFRTVADLLGPASLLALTVMRVGCLLHGCCHGRPTGMSWGLVFTDPRCRVKDAWLGLPLHPTQVYESLGALALFLWVDRRLMAGEGPGRGRAFVASVAGYAVLRFFLESVRGTDAGLLQALGLSTGQWLAAASLAGALALGRAWRRAEGPAI